MQKLFQSQPQPIEVTKQSVILDLTVLRGNMRLND